MCRVVRMKTKFELQPTLIGKLVTIRPLQMHDFNELFAVASDPLIWDQHPFPRCEENAFREFFDAAVESKSGFVFLDNQTQKIFGASRFYNIESDYVFIGYTFLARSHWGGAFNYEIKVLMIDKTKTKICMAQLSCFQLAGICEDSRFIPTGAEWVLLAKSQNVVWSGLKKEPRLYLFF